MSKHPIWSLTDDDWEDYDQYACPCCSWYDEDDEFERSKYVPEEFHWWSFGAFGDEDEFREDTPSLDGSSRGTTAFAVRRRK